MAYLNLKAEMAKRDVTIEAISKHLKLHRGTVAGKVNGPSRFSIDEALEVRDTFFPGVELSYLFGPDE